jgi:hypothetical protein
MDTKRFKQDHFSRYAANLSIYRPEYQETFMCPICQRTFLRSNLNLQPPKISVAHAPPEAVDGIATTLSCTECEKRSSKWDRQVKFEKEMFDAIENKEIKNVTLVSKNGTRLPGDLKIKSNDIIDILSNLPSEQLQKVNKKLMDEESVTGPLIFTPRLPKTPRIKKDYVASHLHSAFLIMFSRFGYEYALSPNVEDIRKVLIGTENAEKYEKAIIAVHVPYESILSPKISIQTKPKDLQCFIIEIPSPRQGDAARIIALPGFGESANISYKNLMSLPFGAESKIKFEKVNIKFGELHRILSDSNSKGHGEKLWEKATM